MFLSNVKESAEQRVTLDYNKDMLQLVLDYFYSEEIQINKDNFAGVMEISHYLQVSYSLVGIHCIQGSFFEIYYNNIF